MGYTFFDNFQLQQSKHNQKFRKLLAIVAKIKAILRKELPSVLSLYYYFFPKHLLPGWYETQYCGMDGALSVAIYYSQYKVVLLF